MTRDRLYFYSGSADRPPGGGVHEAVSDPPVYAALARTPGWRRMLSNFWVADFVVEGSTYRTVEHRFQAAKIALADPVLARRFTVESGSALGLGDGAEARAQRKLVVLSPQHLAQWERGKHAVMRDAMRAKFQQHQALAQVLLATGSAELWHGTGRGQPPQRITDLELVRDELRAAGR